ncbi:hypothetical protein ACIPZG_13130 [Pseudomonas sp. NPDC089395]|uniref:hypothetical protein n=1 Tax=Pseudomonas sp. NPDC089395 TaxID=3364460 RepID=UPI003803DC3C
MQSSKPFVIAAMAALSISGCQKEDEASCASMEQAFFKRSLDAYYSEHDQSALSSYELEPGERYDSTNNWWIVPFKLKEKGYLAMISCDGRLELSVGKP